MEIWKDIKGYEGLYQISNKANVKSLDRNVKNSRNESFKTIKSKTKKSCLDSKGYLYVSLWKNNKGKNVRIHRMIIQAFKGYSDLFVNHIDGNKLNNSLDNLEYVTQRENLTHGAGLDTRSSKYTGVCRHKGKWQTTLSYKNKTLYLGRYETEEEAHKAYLDALKKYNITNKYA